MALLRKKEGRRCCSLLFRVRASRIEPAASATNRGLKTERFCFRGSSAVPPTTDRSLAVTVVPVAMILVGMLQKIRPAQVGFHL